MIFGECPYCDKHVDNAMPEHSGVFLKCICESCDKTYWLWASRVQSWAMTEEGFLQDYIVDEESKTVEERNPAPPLTPLQKQVQALLFEGMSKAWEDLLLNGVGGGPYKGLLSSIDLTLDSD